MDIGWEENEKREKEEPWIEWENRGRQRERGRQRKMRETGRKGLRGETKRWGSGKHKERREGVREKRGKWGKGGWKTICYAKGTMTRHKGTGKREGGTMTEKRWEEGVRGGMNTALCALKGGRFDWFRTFLQVNTHTHTHTRTHTHTHTLCRFL